MMEPTRDRNPPIGDQLDRRAPAGRAGRHGLTGPLRSLAVAAALVATGLVVAENSPYYVGVSQSFGHESNLLRLNDGVSAPAGYSRADTVSSTALLAGIDQPWGRQRLRGDLALRMNRYSENDIFNNQSYNANLALDWATVNRLSGTLSTNLNRSLSSFNRQEQDFLRVKNFEDTRTVDASFQLGMVTQYSLLASFGHREVVNSLPEPGVQARNFRQDTASLGLRWQPSNLITLGVGLRASQGRYPKFLEQPGGGFLADEYTRTDFDLTADYRPTGLSTLSARLSSGRSEYDRATQRDFSGFTGSLNWTWQATGKVRFNTNLSRDTGQESTIGNALSGSGPADYSRVNTALRVGADWAVTGKLSANASVSARQRDLVTSLPTQGSILDASGKEKFTSFSVGARWAPTRSSLVGCNANTDRINGSSSDISRLSVKNTKGGSFNCYGQITLQ